MLKVGILIVQGCIYILTSITPLEIGKLLVFVNDKKNVRFIEDIAGRNMNRWCKSESKKISDGQYRSDDRYEAVNTVPSKTVS